MPAKAAVTKGRRVAGKRYPLNMRVTFETRKALEESARESGRSLAQEAENRLNKSYSDDAARAFNSEMLDTLVGPSAQRVVGMAMIGAFATATQHYAKLNKLAGELIDWNSHPGCWEAGTLAVVSELLNNAPDGPIGFKTNLNSLIRQLRHIAEANK